MFVGVCRVLLHLHGNTSLKGKRSVVKSVIERTRAKFNASVAEVSDNDLKRQAVIGVAVVGNTAKHVDSMLGHIGGYIDWLGLATVASRRTEVIPLGGDLGSSDDLGFFPEFPGEPGEAGEGRDEEEEEW